MHFSQKEVKKQSALNATVLQKIIENIIWSLRLLQWDSMEAFCSADWAAAADWMSAEPQPWQSPPDRVGGDAHLGTHRRVRDPGGQRLELGPEVLGQMVLERPRQVAALIPLPPLSRTEREGMVHSDVGGPHPATVGRVGVPAVAGPSLNPRPEWTPGG